MPATATAALQASDVGCSGPSCSHTNTRLGGSDIVPCADAVPVDAPTTAAREAAGTAATARATFA
ncbi:hypothetical protein [Actinomadura logoneensis]|uniref:hypothetical protein n=1 Tax=Actinomadura logoneensis TaxID=2293572 RepID=UPI001F48EEB4|nr:hypothetical protein [Actinomadura logoneensis]